MKKFNDPPVHGCDDYWARVRQADMYEVARRLKRSGMRHVTVVPALLTVVCVDPVSGARVILEIEPWSPIDEGWYWYASIATRKTCSMGALMHGRRMLRSPWPREVTRALWRELTFDRRSFRKVR